MSGKQIVQPQPVNLHLVCNAHLDPVWQWDWPEAVSEAISTFRIAAQFCREFPGFIFNHNEMLLYRWVEWHETDLFREIQRLVKAGRWHIMGGWYLQPDCNMPSGESFVRQLLIGKHYFRKKFGVEVTTAANLDSFGHTRGLVQILAKSGYDSYLFGRPDQTHCILPSEDFVWVGYDGSEIMAHRTMDLYTTQRGQAVQKIEKWLHRQMNAVRAPGMLLWGIGNHGGGPSRLDLRKIERFRSQCQQAHLMHSFPKAYFKELHKVRENLPKVSADLQHCMTGCYSSMARIKREYRQLENDYFSTEKMVSAAAVLCRMSYPVRELAEALEDLLFVQFHDAVTGTSVQPAEQSLLATLGHGLEIIKRLKVQAMLVLTASFSRAEEGVIPIMVYNPHAFAVKQQVVCEVSPDENNFSGGYKEAFVYHNGRKIPSQTEQPSCSIKLDGRKRVVFYAELKPGQVNRFDCRLKKIECRPQPVLQERNGTLHFKNRRLEVRINCRTGLIDDYRVKGCSYLGKDAFLPLVFADSADSWASKTSCFDRQAGAFKLLSASAAARVCGVNAHTLSPVRVIEDGPVRSIVEALFGYRDSVLCQRYIMGKTASEIEIETRVYWNEKDRMLKLSIPFGKKEAYQVFGQTAYGHSSFEGHSQERVAQRWLMLVSRQNDRAVTCINDAVYGFDFTDRQLQLTLLRSPAYCGFQCMNQTTVVPSDRFTPRMDQGEHVFHFWIDAGTRKQRRATVEREALAKNEMPFALPCFPSGKGRTEKPVPFWYLDDPVIVTTAAKKAENGNAFILRLFEPTGKPRTTTLVLPFLNKRVVLQFTAFEIKTLCVTKSGKVQEADLMERIYR